MKVFSGAEDQAEGTGSDASLGEGGAEISYACGFGQVSFFNRSFRKWKGCSPGEWRKGKRGERM
jgi:AraC-like DNA-binding protein